MASNEEEDIKTAVAEISSAKAAYSRDPSLRNQQAINDAKSAAQSAYRTYEKVIKDSGQAGLRDPSYFGI